VIGLLVNEILPYETWDIELFAPPARSRLYHLEPAQMGTPFAESLTSYIVRLAARHGVSTRTLVTHEIFPHFGKAYLSSGWKSNNVTAFWKDSSTLNGVSASVNSWVGVLEELTLRDDLRFTTMLPWACVVSPKDLIRSFRAWCPFCYQEWKQDNRVVYDALLWSLQVVKVCPIHGVPMHLQCPHAECRRRSYMLAPRAVPGHCSHCGRWLGLPSDECLQSGAACLDMEEVRWQRWVSAEVGKLLAASPNLGVAPGRKNFSEAVELYLHEIAGGNVSAIARMFRVDRKTIRGWKNGIQVPQLASLLQICYLCDISPLSLFTDDMKIREFAKATVPATLSKNKKYYRSFDRERMRRTLEAELVAGSYPPHSMCNIARKLGYDHSFLCKYFPDLCRAISARFEAYRANQCEEKKQGIINEVRRAALKVHSEGLYPSQVRVRNLLTRPGTIRIPEALNAWHSALKELGWEK
jgi:TniQ